MTRRINEWSSEPIPAGHPVGEPVTPPALRAVTTYVPDGPLTGEHPEPAGQRTWMLGLRADIHRSRSIGDCANGGISSRADHVTIVGPDVTAARGCVFSPDDEAPAVQIIVRLMGPGRPTVHLAPIDEPPGTVGPMMGGTYVGTSDSRFREAIRLAVKRAGGPDSFDFYGALALHDRFETPEQYRALSI